MSFVNLDGKRFSPTKNSPGGRVKSDAVFIYKQTGKTFTATYSGEGVSDGHIIGVMTGPNQAELVYHSRAANGDLEAGKAEVTFLSTENKTIDMALNWQWMNGTQESGTSYYEECLD